MVCRIVAVPLWCRGPTHGSPRPVSTSIRYTVTTAEAILAAPLAAQDQVIIKSVREALNVFDFDNPDNDGQGRS